MKKVLAIAGALLVLAIILLFFFKGFGLGGNGSGDDVAVSPTQQETNTKEPEKENVDETEVTTKVVTVTIKENQVFVGEKEFTNEADLKSYVEEINNDERKFKLKEENSILDTYEWVNGVFENLKIQLIPVED